MTDIAAPQPTAQEQSADEPLALATFWQNVEELAATFATVFKLVVAYLDRQETATLRGVNRAMRQAINRTVTTVVYSPQADLLLCDLALVFPEASRLFVSWMARYPIVATAEEADIVFNRILESSPVLLQKIQSLSMQLVGMPASKSLAGCMAEFLARCGFDVAPSATTAHNPLHRETATAWHIHLNASKSSNRTARQLSHGLASWMQVHRCWRGVDHVWSGLWGGLWARLRRGLLGYGAEAGGQQ
jgi:hypothetical protein